MKTALARLPTRAAFVWPWMLGIALLTLGCGEERRVRGPTVLYDRADARATAPLPDDFYWRADADSPTGGRIAVHFEARRDEERALFESLTRETRSLDGWSPIAHAVIPLEAEPDPASLAQDVRGSLAADASILLLELGTGGEISRRVPYRVVVRREEDTEGAVSHLLLLFPAVSLRPGRAHAWIVSERLRARGGAGFGASPFFERVRGPRREAESPAVTRVRSLLAPVWDALEQQRPALDPDEVALALRFSVRSRAPIAHDLSAIRSQLAQAPAPAIEWIDHAPIPGGRLLRGRFQAPEYRSEGSLARDPDGAPREVSRRAIGFVLAVPERGGADPAPILVYQHGSPGSAEDEIPREALPYLEAGFAVAGFTDVMNRELRGPSEGATDVVLRQALAVFLALLRTGRVVDLWTQTTAEQLAFLRALEALGSAGSLPGSAEREPEVAGPEFYLGVSQGANHGVTLLPYAPGIRAAALIGAGARLTEMAIHQQPDLLVQSGLTFFPGLGPADVWAGLALFQLLFDAQDPHLHAPFLYREPAPAAPAGRRASVLLIEGLGDTRVPNAATESLAHALLPLPQVMPARRAVFLDEAPPPLAGNVAPDTTAALVQLVPPGLAPASGEPRAPTPTPGCTVLPPGIGEEGHFCAHRAEEARALVLRFFETARTGRAPVVDPRPALE